MSNNDDFFNRDNSGAGTFRRGPADNQFDFFNDKRSPETPNTNNNAGSNNMFSGGNMYSNNNGNSNMYSNNQNTQNTPNQMPIGNSSGVFSFSQTSSMQNKPYQLPDNKEYVSPRNYQNVVVYAPRNPEDVQRLIDYMKRREPAIVNLDDADENSAQRILDFVCGAIYALNGSVHRIASNIFLLSPEGVEITVPYEPK